MAKGFSSSERGEIPGSAPRFSADALVAGAILVGALYAGRDVFVPVVLSILLSFVLAGPARLLGRIGLGRTPAVALVVCLAFVALIGLASVLVTQMTSLAGDLPRYQSTIREKITSLRSATGGGPLERAFEMVQTLADEVGGGHPVAGAAAPDTLTDGSRPPSQAPVPVQITNPATSPFETVRTVLTPLLHPLATTALVAIFVVFILLQQGDLRNRLIRLAGSHDLQRTTAAMNDAARRLSRYFLIQVSLNATFGTIVGLGLWAIGVPSPTLWGILAAISRFVPYVGAVMAASGPLLLAAAVDPGWSMLVLTAALFAFLEFAVAQVVEPLAYGHSTGLTPVAVIVSVTFWTWVWGPVGLLLATPLTVVLVVLGRHVDALRFLDVMFGDRPPLTAAESFYQRMLAGDPGEAYERAEQVLKSHALVGYYDEIALKGLGLAAADAARGALGDERLARVEDAIATLVDDLSDHEETTGQDLDRPAPARAEGDADLDASLDYADRLFASFAAVTEADIRPEWREPGALTVVALRDGLDRAGAAMLGQIVGRHGLRAEVVGGDALAPRGPDPAGLAQARLVCISVLDTSSPARVRYAVRRLRRLAGSATVMVGAWGSPDEADATALCAATKADRCVASLAEAARTCLALATGREAPDALADEPTAGSAPGG